MNKYKFKLKAGTGQKTTIVEEFTISRATAEPYLKMLNRRRELDAAQQKLKVILEDALAKPDWKTMRIKIQR